ncbi:MAG: YggS family pyridoxal phosphate-dependent enzyme [Tenericutes bacterium HGW-Tenericutes-5]|jgi:pyridoxal phosphate enzyme (YggS family)|nr:MAG: YggS family pyridoxal phosphate-dependent enzyme [Tenericutes bacterium HGW-Tenericutes-5]
MINSEIIPILLEETKDSLIVAATKYGDATDVKELFDCGINNIGENRTNAFLEKYDLLHDLDITWHFIGHLQSKKVKTVIDKIDFLHSLDRISLADEIQKYRKLPLNCFIEVNIADEDSKYGLAVDEVVSFYQKIKNYDKIRVIGLMGMASLTEDTDLIHSQFEKLVYLKEELNKNHDGQIEYLSMGMTNDYKIALKLGATHLRLGSILFKKGEN